MFWIVHYVLFYKFTVTYICHGLWTLVLKKFYSKKIFVCLKQLFCFVGKRYMRWGGRDSYNCSDSRYQPRKFWSNVTSDCEMQKSNCCEEGQVAMSYGSTTEDRTCRCDNLNGFAFITTHKDVCSCIPSQEDCSCYRTKFAEGEILTKGMLLKL